MCRLECSEAWYYTIKMAIWVVNMYIVWAMFHFKFIALYQRTCSMLRCKIVLHSMFDMINIYYSRNQWSLWHHWPYNAPLPSHRSNLSCGDVWACFRKKIKQIEHLKTCVLCDREHMLLLFSIQWLDVMLYDNRLRSLHFQQQQHDK